MTNKVTLIPGDGIEPEVSSAAQSVITASGAPIEWEVVEAGEACIAQYGTPLPEHVLETIRRNKVALGRETDPASFRSCRVESNHSYYSLGVWYAYLSLLCRCGFSTTLGSASALVGSN